MNREAQHVLDLVIRPLTPLHSMGDENGEFLLCRVGAVESGYDNLRQVLASGNYGIALGWWQMEPDTYVDALNWLEFFPDLKERILTACYLDIMPPKEVLIWNIRFAACMARVQFWRHKEKLPNKDDLEGQARYWIKYYNGNGEGKGTIERFVNVSKNLGIK